MKRVLLAIGLLVLVLAACAGSLIYQQRQINRLEALTDGLEASYRSGLMEESVQKATELADYFIRCARVFACYMSHNELNNSLDTVVALAATLEEDNPEEFLLELAKFRQQLAHLWQIEIPRFSNIL